MNKERTLRIVLTAIAVALIVGAVCLYLYGVLYENASTTENLPRVIIISVSAILLIAKINLGASSRGSLVDYEKAFSEEIGNAFLDQSINRTKLICAARLYNESNYRKALKYLFQLLPAARDERDSVPVLLFIALCYTDGGLPIEAVKAYETLLKTDPYNSQAHSNLGLLYIKLGDHEKGLTHYEKALEYNPNNYYAWNNRANYYFRIYEYEKAIADAHKALEIKNNGVESASLLAVLYALTDNAEMKEKYFHVATVLGKNPNDLKESIAYFKQNKESTADE